MVAEQPANNSEDSKVGRPVSVPRNQVPSEGSSPSGASEPPVARKAAAQAGSRSLLSLGRWRRQRRLRVTREGKYFIGITLGVGFAAVNTGNNLLYLLLGMLLALIVVSSVMSELSLRRLTVVRRLPPRAQVGKSHLVEVEVHNHKQKVPSYAIEIEDLRDGQPADKRCFFLKISPDSAQIAAYRRTPARRGRDRHVGFRIATRFPFGLFEKSRETSSEGEIIIYPEILSVALPALNQGNAQGQEGRMGRGFGDELYGVRPMREGDDPRDIYWRKSATGGPQVLRERARETSRHVHLIVDSVYSGSSPDPGWLEQLEDRIRETASLSVAHIKRGDVVHVRTTAGEVVVGNANVGADPVLRFLALLVPSSSKQAEKKGQQDGPPSSRRGRGNPQGHAA